MSDRIVQKTVLMEETWRKVGGKVYWYYRFAGQRHWTKQLTSFNQVPYIKIKANWGDFARP